VGATSKTDRLDGRKLAEYASSGMLRSIAVPTETEEGFRALVRRRHRLTDSIRHAKQRILGRTGLPQKAIVAVARKLAITLWRLNVSPVTA
jgi:transposase